MPNLYSVHFLQLNDKAGNEAAIPCCFGQKRLKEIKSNLIFAGVINYSIYVGGFSSTAARVENAYIIKIRLLRFKANLNKINTLKLKV